MRRLPLPSLATPLLAPMVALFLALFPIRAHAWSAAGHRLIAVIAWDNMAPTTRNFVTQTLSRHPDHGVWTEKSGTGEPRLIFAEAATWPDNIRNDPRFYDERRDAPTPPIPGLPDTARHKTWHYLDLDAQQRVVKGELDRQIERLSRQLEAGDDPVQASYALPWLAHLVGDIHQPLHVGRHGDQGGNDFEIENPARPRQPFTNLHSFWDELPGPSGLRGKRLDKAADALTGRYPAPLQGDVASWRRESHALLVEAYPPQAGSLLPLVTDEFRQHSEEIAGRRIIDAGYRLARLLDQLARRHVPRGTPPSRN